MDVTGSWRRIQDEIIQIAPVGIPNQLLQRVACHSSSPESRLVWLHEETNAQDFHAILLDGFDQVAPVDFFAVGTFLLNLEHLRNAWAEDVAVQQTYPVA